jgi:hypothetical protein
MRERGEESGDGTSSNNSSTTNQQKGSSMYVSLPIPDIAVTMNSESLALANTLSILPSPPLHLLQRPSRQEGNHKVIPPKKKQEATR